MKLNTPYEKLAKRDRRKRDILNRNDWNGVNPVTRRIGNVKKYNRKREKNRLSAEARRLGGFLYAITA